MQIEVVRNGAGIELRFASGQASERRPALEGARFLLDQDGKLLGIEIDDSKLLVAEPPSTMRGLNLFAPPAEPDWPYIG